jgi:CheY-like chemotaxis protein
VGPPPHNAAPMALVDPPRVLVVADGEESGRTVAALLGGDLAAGVRTTLRPDQAAAHARTHRAEVIVLAQRSLVEIEHDAPALRAPLPGTTTPPVLIALCDAASVAAAARLCRKGVIDDYVQHFPVPGDESRLATSVRLAARVAAAARNAAPPAQAQAETHAAAGPAAWSRPLVLVVEDDKVLHTLVAAMLAPEDVDLVFETDGSTALERIEALAPDLVLMDIGLPGSDGLALTEQIKSTRGISSIPVVMLTGEARADTLVRSVQAGAADFVVKPFTREALLAKLNKYLPAPV